jgi:hypothetical protein
MPPIRGCEQSQADEEEQDFGESLARLGYEKQQNYSRQHRDAGWQIPGAEVAEEVFSGVEVHALDGLVV